MTPLFRLNLSAVVARDATGAVLSMPALQWSKIEARQALNGGARRSERSSQPFDRKTTEAERLLVVESDLN
jgi:hypothetical protein